jgi:hypothetical protein
VAASPGAPPYVQAWWLHATSGRWAAVVELGPDGEYYSLLPLPLKWRPWGRIAYQPLFTQQLGLVLTSKSRYLQVTDYLALARTGCVAFYQQWTPTTPVLALPTGFAVAERLTYHLDLGTPSQQPSAGAALARGRKRRPGRHNYFIPNVPGDRAYGLTTTPLCRAAPPLRRATCPWPGRAALRAAPSHRRAARGGIICAARWRGYLLICGGVTRWQSG